MRSLVQRAEASGYTAVVVTIDKADNYPHYDGPRGHEFERHGYESYFSDPAFRAKFGGQPEKQFDAAWRLWKDIRLAQGLSLSELGTIVKQTKLPVVVKGILNPEDARLAEEQGAAGVVVSNHGGRSLDGVVPALDALPAVRKAVRPGFTVLLDSGIRSGTDIVKALALGADAAMVGKAYALALGAAGEEGVRKALGGLVGEFEAAMALCGALRPGDIGPDSVVHA